MVLKDGFSSRSAYGLPANPKSAEAQLLSQATSTATVAARSILMSGGTEEVALRTAKAAAQSVLIPNASDADTISGRSTNTFLRRRKAKRQAEVVASMALMTAASNVRSGSIGTDWDTLTASTGNNTRSTNPYAKNITTRSMQDEPSVLSGSTRPPRATPRSNSGMHPPSISERISSRTSSQSTPSRNTRIMMGIYNSSKGHKDMLPNEDKKKQSFMGKMKPQENDSQVFSEESGESEDVAEENDALSSLLADSSAEEESGSVLTDADDATTGNTIPKDLWKQLDPLLVSFTNTMNFTCSPLTSFINAAVSESDAKSAKSKKKKKQLERSNGSELSEAEAEQRQDVDGEESYDDQEVLSGDETEAEERDDVEDDCRSGDSYDQSEIVKERYLSSSSSASSVDSSQIVRELNSCSSSEAEIQVRSSIRETMEKIVSKSKKQGSNFDGNFDTGWKTYEMKQGSDQGKFASNTKSKKQIRQKGKTSAPVKSPSTSKRGFFFKKRKSKN